MTQSTREGFHWPQITATLSQSQTSSGTVELKNLHWLVLIINNTVCPAFTEEGQPEKKKLFCSPVSGWKSSSWSAEVHLFRAQRWARGLGAGGRCLFRTTLRIFISMRSVKNTLQTFWSIPNTAAPPQKPTLAPTTAHLEPFAVAFHSSICQPAVATLKL